MRRFSKLDLFKESSLVAQPEEADSGAATYVGFVDDKLDPLPGITPVYRKQAPFNEVAHILYGIYPMSKLGPALGDAMEYYDIEEIEDGLGFSALDEKFIYLSWAGFRSTVYNTPRELEGEERIRQAIANRFGEVMDRAIDSQGRYTFVNWNYIYPYKDPRAGFSLIRYIQKNIKDKYNLPIVAANGNDDLASHVINNGGQGLSIPGGTGPYWYSI